MATPKDIEDFLASRDTLEVAICSFNEGKRELYRAVATELRKLLCDGNNSLVPRMFPDATLNPLVQPIPPEVRTGFQVFIPSTIEFDGKGGSRIVKLIDESAPPISVEAWLSQELFNERITIRELVRSVADKQGAHSDKNYNETLRFSNGVRLITEGIHKQHIVALGEYVLKIMNRTIENNPALFPASQRP